MSRPWIPPWPLVAGQLAHGASWLLLLLLARRGDLGFSFAGLAWVHLVALGWLTLVALAVFVHVVRGFLGARWRGEAMARWALLPYALGVAGLVASFWHGSTQGLAGSALLIATALAAYLGAAAATLWGVIPEDRADAMVRRAFALVLTLLGATAGFGLAMAWALARGGAAWLLTAAPPIHAHLGAVGWLTLLVMGVSMRTARPITGGRSAAPGLHVAATSLLAAGVLALATGLGAGWPYLPAAGAGCAALGVLLYVFDAARVLARAIVPHRPPQAFLAAANLYLLAAAGLGLGVLAGRTEWQPAYAFLGLMGWLGQEVNGHLHHIGVRLLITLARGEDDETRPQEVLAAPLSWLTWAAFQAAVVGTAWGLLRLDPWLVQASAIAGVLGWLAMLANLLMAWRRARTDLPGELTKRRS